MMNFKLTVFVPWGVMPPWWAGVIYIDRIRDGWVCTLIPFNLLTRLLRAFWYWVKYPEKASIEERMTGLELYNNELIQENIKLKDILKEAKGTAIEIKQDLDDLVKGQ